MRVRSDRVGEGEVWSIVSKSGIEGSESGKGGVDVEVGVILRAESADRRCVGRDGAATGAREIRSCDSSASGYSKAEERCSPSVNFAKANSDDARPPELVSALQLLFESLQVKAAQVSSLLLLLISQVDHAPPPNADDSSRLLDARVRIRDQDVDFNTAEPVFRNGPICVTASSALDARDGPIATESEADDVGCGGASRDGVLGECLGGQGQKRKEVVEREVFDRHRGGGFLQA